MTLKMVYERYKHMDRAFLDPKVYKDNFERNVIADLWQAIKEHLEKEEGNAQSR